jgi:acyl-CoA synthetase (NDP forming)
MTNSDLVDILEQLATNTGGLVKRGWNFGEGFPPKTVAIAGVSRNNDSAHPGYTGLGILRILQNAGFQGHVYPVNPYASVIDGVKVYPNVTSIPELLDLVIITVPPAVVPQVVRDCVAAKALNVQICTSGFGETGEAEGKILESEIREIALRGGLRVIGPNCMGFQIPSVHMQMHADTPSVPGPVAFVSQSGGHARIYLLRGPQLGIGFSKVISYGNALLMDAPDFFEYLAKDPETQIICLYLEGVKDGRWFMELVRQTNLMKPVIIWKAGFTGPGARAAASHTNSLAGNKQIWEAFFRQTGAVEVHSIEEMAEVTMTFLRLAPSPGKRAVVLAAGGGSSVATGDICAEEGIVLPALSEHTRAGLLEFISLVNQGVANPIDVPSVVLDSSSLQRAYELLASDPQIDIIMLHLGAEFFAGPMVNVMAELQKRISISRPLKPVFKPVVVALSEEGQVHDTEKYAQQLREAGITTYNSLRRACRALNRFASYHEFVMDGGMHG